MLVKKLFRLALLGAVPALLLMGCDNKDTSAPPPKITKAKKPAPPSETPDATSTEAEPATSEEKPVMTSTQPPDSPPDAPVEPPMKDIEVLNLAVADFGGLNGRLPKGLEELVKLKVISKIPEAPPGKKYVIDPKLRKVVMVNK